MEQERSISEPKSRSSGSELFIVDNSDEQWKVRDYLHDWCQLAGALDIATGYFEIGSLLALDGEWQKVDNIRILMGDEVSRRTKQAFVEGLEPIKQRLDLSLESEKEKNDFLIGVPAVVILFVQGRYRRAFIEKTNFMRRHTSLRRARLSSAGLHSLDPRTSLIRALPKTSN